MDFLDSFELSKYKKSRRVRSWYLYEQFKSLEHNQLDAARKLKSRSYQDRILRQELSERKARRKLYDQFGHSQSDYGIESSLKSEPTKTSLNISSDDFFESFHELQNDEELSKVENLDDVIPHESRSVKFPDNLYGGDDKNDHKNDESYPDSVVNVKSGETLTAHMNNCTEKHRKAQRTSPQPQEQLDFDMVKQKLLCLERLANNIRDIDKFSENDSLNSIDDEELKHIIMQDKDVNTSDNSIHYLWSKLVSFAYQIMELNHGNCYYDYGSQLLTAVLACDVLRRGINRMCHILQPYVSPLKYSTDSDSSEKGHKNIKRKNRQRRKQFINNHDYKRRKSKNALNETTKKYCSRNSLEQPSPFSTEKFNAKRFHLSSEPGRKLAANNRNLTLNRSHIIWPYLKGEEQSLYLKTCTCSACPKIVNPMLQISRYLDKLRRDIDFP